MIPRHARRLLLAVVTTLCLGSVVLQGQDAAASNSPQDAARKPDRVRINLDAPAPSKAKPSAAPTSNAVPQSTISPYSEEALAEKTLKESLKKTEPSTGAVSSKGPKSNPGKATKEGKDAKKPAEVPPFVVARAKGGFLSIRIEGGCFALHFYDEKKEPVRAPDAKRATIRWTSPKKAGREFQVLGPSSDGRYLVGNRFVDPPRRYKLYIALLGDQEQVLESLVVDYQEK